MCSGTVSAWLKKVGDEVDEDEVIAQIETDKITVDVRSPKRAVVQKLLAKEGDTVAVDEDLFILASADSTATTPTTSTSVPTKSVDLPPTSAANGSAEVSDIVVPDMGESITEGTIAQWLVEPGTAVSEDEVLAQIETDKIVVDVRAPKAGIFLKQLASVGDNVPVGKPIASMKFGEAAPGKTFPPFSMFKACTGPPTGPPTVWTLARQLQYSSDFILNPCCIWWWNVRSCSYA